MFYVSAKRFYSEERVLWVNKMPTRGRLAALKQCGASCRPAVFSAPMFEPFPKHPSPWVKFLSRWNFTCEAAFSTSPICLMWKSSLFPAKIYLLAASAY